MNIKKVLFKTFQPRCNQGMVIFLGGRDVEIEEVSVKPLGWNGCISSEVMPEQKVLAVDLLGRKFLVKPLDTTFRSSDPYKDCTYEVTIPRDLADKIFSKCPHCGHAL